MNPVHERLARLFIRLALPSFCIVGGACSEAEPADCEPAPLLDDPRGGEAQTVVDEHHDERWSCGFKPGTEPETSVSGDIQGLRDNVKHVFVLMLENRSFDQFLSELSPDRADVATDQSNPGPDGQPVARVEAKHLCLKDVSHEWMASHLQYDNGRNDGFVTSGGPRAMAYYGRKQLPFHYFLAETFATSDRYFASVMGPTWPNHLFFWKGTSCGYAEDATTNPSVVPACGMTGPSIFSELDQDIGVYDDSGPTAVGMITGAYLQHLPQSIQAFKAAAKKETSTFSALPKVVMLGASNTSVDLPVFKRRQNDDHANVNVQLAQKFIYEIVSTVTSNDALWRSSVLFITWDEHGGFYDHVAPPKACHPNENPPPDEPRFDRLGFRVPLYVISPFVRRHYVSHYVAEHASILRFIEAWRGVRALTKRDANAWAMLDFFDFAEPHFEVPALPAQDAEPTAEGLAECMANPGGFLE